MMAIEDLPLPADAAKPLPAGGLASALFCLLTNANNGLFEALLSLLPSDAIPPLADVLAGARLLGPPPPATITASSSVENSLDTDIGSSDTLSDFLEFLKAVPPPPRARSPSAPGDNEVPEPSLSASLSASLSSRVAEPHGTLASPPTTPTKRQRSSSGLFSILRGVSLRRPSVDLANQNLLCVIADHSDDDASRSRSAAASTTTPPPSSSSLSTSTSHTSVAVSPLALSSPAVLNRPSARTSSSKISFRSSRRTSVSPDCGVGPLPGLTGNDPHQFSIESSPSSGSSISMASTSSPSLQRDVGPAPARSQPQLALLLSMVERAVELELGQTRDRSVLFRSDSNAIVFVSHLLRRFGNPFLRQLLSPLMLDMLYKANFELDPNRLNRKKTGADQLARKTEARKKQLLTFCQSLLQAVFGAAAHLPVPVLKICRLLHRLFARSAAAAGERPERHARDAAAFVQSLLFLRWICPLLLTEQWTGGMPARKSLQQKRNVVLVGKIVQSAANGAVPSESYLGFCADFIERNKRAFARFVAAVTVDFVPCTSAAAAAASVAQSSKRRQLAASSSSSIEHQSFCNEHNTSSLPKLLNSVDLDLIRALSAATPLLPSTSTAASTTASTATAVESALLLPAARRQSSTESMQSVGSSSSGGKGSRLLRSNPSSPLPPAAAAAADSVSDECSDADSAASALDSLLSDVNTRWLSVEAYVQQRSAAQPASNHCQQQWHLLGQLARQRHVDLCSALLKPEQPPQQNSVWTFDSAVELELPLYCQPSPRSKLLGCLRRGADVQLLASYHLDWVKIRIDGAVGWVQYAALGSQQLFPTAVDTDARPPAAFLVPQLKSMQMLLEEMAFASSLDADHF